MRTLPLLALICALTPISAQRLVWVDGPSAVALTLRVLDENRPTATPSVLRTGVQLMPIELTNRTAQRELRGDISRLVHRASQRSIELPDGGRIVQYRLRGGQRWGYLLLRPDGTPVILIERNGIGGAGLDSPFADRIGVAPDGRHAAITTASGSQLLAVRLDGRTYTSTGQPWRDTGVSGSIDPMTMSPGANYLFAGTEGNRAYRIAWTEGAAVQDVTPPFQTGARLQDQFCISDDGRRCAFLFGPQRLYSIYLVGETGPARRLPPPAAKYEEPGYLPEDTDGPRMMLNADGTRLMYTDATVRDEIYWLDTTAATPTTHVTGDANFQPYIGIGVLPVTMAANLVVGVGDVQAFDVYAATTTQRIVTNLTETNGNLTPPFATGSLWPRNTATTTNGQVLADVINGTRRELWTLSPGAVRRTLRLNGALERGAGFGSRDYRVASTTGVRLLAPDGSTLLGAPPGIVVSNTASAPGDAFRVFAAGLTVPTVLMVRLVDGTLFGVDVGERLRDAVVTARGIALDTASAIRYVHAGGVVTVSNTPGEVRHVLSGAGTAD